MIDPSPDWGALARRAVVCLALFVGGAAPDWFGGPDPAQAVFPPRRLEDCTARHGAAGDARCAIATIPASAGATFDPAATATRMPRSTGTATATASRTPLVTVTSTAGAGRGAALSAAPAAPTPTIPAR